MSTDKIAKRTIIIPKGVRAKQEKTDYGFSFFWATGPKGESRKIKMLSDVEIFVDHEEGKITTSSETNKPLAGTYNSIIKNVVFGVNNGYQKDLEIKGVGFKAEIKEKKIFLSLGKSHPNICDIPSNLEITVTGQRKIVIKGIDKEEVNGFAAKIRNLKKPGVYHEKGVYYFGEKIKLKPTKSAKKQQ